MDRLRGTDSNQKGLDNSEKIQKIGILMCPQTFTEVSESVLELMNGRERLQI